MKNLTDYLVNEQKYSNNLQYSLTIYDDKKMSNQNYGYGKAYLCENIESLESCYNQRAGEFDKVKTNILKLKPQEIFITKDYDNLIIISAIDYNNI